MDWFSQSNFLIWSFIIISPPLLLLFYYHRRRSNRLPPGPQGWPVFGYMFNLGTMPHRTLSSLKQKYGPVIWLKLGSTNTMVILTANSAADFFKNHDLSFADRTITHTMRSHDFHKSSISVAPYGAYWRAMRRLCTVEMFTSRRINETATVREKCVDDLLEWVEKEAREVGEERGIHVARLVFLAAFNMIGNLVLSRGLVDNGSKVGLDFFTAMDGIGEWAGSPNISDLFPWVSGLDLQGLRKKMDRDKGKALEIATGFVKERIEEREKTRERKKDILDIVLDFEGSGKDEPAIISKKDVNIFILEMFMTASETTSSTIEWVMTELLCNPEVITKAKTELTKIIGPKMKFEEGYIDNLPYLQAVIKETLRLHPPVPFLVPRRASQDVDFMGYRIPKNTQVFVNTWAIGRDSECWDDPFSFKPERFLGSKTDFKGQHFEFIPFGAGRRMCPGIPLAQRMVPLVLGSLLFEFDWELDGHVTCETMDMREKLGMTMRKLEPLKVIPKRSKPRGNFPVSLGH